MPHLYVSSDPATGPTGQTQGYVYERTDAGVLQTKVSGVISYERRSVILKYRRNTHIVGTFSRPQVRDRFGSYHSSGVRGPVTRPTLVDGAFPSGSEGNMIGYQTFLMKVGNEVIAESNPGPQTATLAAAGTGRLWGNLDWSPSDPHVTHARGYVSVDGSLPALAWERPLSPAGTTVTENVGTIALGITLPVRKGVNQQFLLDIYARGVVPYTRYAEEYHDAFFYAGDPQHPERIYYSKLFEPEAVNSTPIYINGRLDEPWLATTDGAPVTGIKRQGDELIVGTYRGIDRIQGYGYGDYAIHRISNYWGVTSHFSMQRCGPNDSLFFSAPQGPTIYNAGNFRFIGEPIQSWWRDRLREDPTVFDDAFGSEDRFWETYNLLLPQADGSSLWLVVDFNFAEAGQPIWVFDRRARKDWVSGELARDSDSKYWERYTGSCDGVVRQENDPSDADDDGDAYQKRMTVQSGHRYMGEQGGDEGHGYAFHPADMYVKHNNNPVTVSFYAGEDNAPPQEPNSSVVSGAATPHQTTVLPATAVAAGERARTARTSERISLQGVSGKGVTMKVEVVAPLDVEFRGWGVQYREGPAGKEPFAQE
jgi:hypothetical protein